MCGWKYNKALKTFEILLPSDVVQSLSNIITSDQKIKMSFVSQGDDLGIRKVSLLVNQ